MSVSDLGCVPPFIQCPAWHQVITGKCMQRIMGSGLGLTARGVLLLGQGSCSGLLFGVAFLPLLDQLDAKSSPVRFSFVLLAPGFGTEGLLFVIVVVFEFSHQRVWLHAVGIHGSYVLCSGGPESAIIQVVFKRDVGGAHWLVLGLGAGASVCLC